MFLGIINCNSLQKHFYKVEEDSAHKFEKYKELIKYIREESQFKGPIPSLTMNLYSTFLSEVRFI